jgi:hypothetical protein
MYSDARNWKWMTPAVLCSVALLVTRAFYFLPGWFPWLSVVSGTMAAVLAIAAIGNLLDYRRERSVAIFERNRRAMAMTPLSSELESSRGVHPDVVKILINERHRVWMLKSGVKTEGIEAHSVLFGAPDVTDYFLQYFLEGSTESAVMPKRVLVQGRKNRFDPWGAVDEYTMYDHLVALLERQGKVQKWTQFEPYVWVDPWAPALVAEDFGLEWSEDAPEKSDVPDVAETKQYAMTVKQLVELNSKNQKEK